MATASRAFGEQDRVPAYLKETYRWAYLNARNVRLLDREWVVRSILWHQHERLQRAALAEIASGARVLQPACVYGRFSVELAHCIGPDGALDIIDVAPIQVANCERKLAQFPQVRVRCADAMDARGGRYDAVCCYFLLHELPDNYKRGVVDALINAVRPGGRLVVVDYHRPHWAHPVRPVTSLVFRLLEPYARALWTTEIADFASTGVTGRWSKQTYFGGLFQKVVFSRAAE